MSLLKVLFPWFFSSWTSSDLHSSGLIFQTAVLSVCTYLKKW
jgi:hypothetical protein